LAGAVVDEELDRDARVGNLDNFDLKVTTNGHEVILRKFSSIAAERLTNGGLSYGGFTEQQHFAPQA
jgi:hypothetical protein